MTEDAFGWIAQIANDPDDPDDEPRVTLYCPICADEEFDLRTRATALFK